MEANNTYSFNFWKKYDWQKVTLAPSSFSEFCLPYMKLKSSVLDICCGNGRDSKYFKSNKMKVSSFDHETLNLFDKISKFNYDQFFDNVYCRFVLHSVPEHIEDYILINSNHVLNTGGLLFIEVRSDKGVLSSKIDKHYRRRIDKEKLLEKLFYLNFEILFETESDGLSIYNRENPVLIRVVAKKKGEINTRGSQRDEKRTYGKLHLMQSIYLLFTVKQIFEDYNIPFFIVFGTLLGAHRNGSFILHDTDIDLALLEKYNDKITQLIDDGYFAIHGLLFIREWYGKHHLKALQYKMDYIDFWFFEKDKGLYRSGKTYTIEAFQIDNGLSNIKLYGQDFKTVHDVEAYFDRHYLLSDWRIPVEDYHSKI
jgi:SAM-dependent methyltransferase